MFKEVSLPCLMLCGSSQGLLSAERFAVCTELPTHSVQKPEGHMMEWAGQISALVFLALVLRHASVEQAKSRRV